MPTVRIKVCGVTSVADALVCAGAGVDWVGLNFHPPSPRYLDDERAAAIVQALPSTTQPVGLFVNRPPREVAERARRLGLRVVQLHGDEPPGDLGELEELEVVRAFRLADLDSIKRMEAFLEQAERLGRVPDAVLVDAFVAGLAGGTGRTIAADLLDHLPPLPRLILSGGLAPDNVAQRVERVRPWMVDVASGVELAPGRKSAEQVRAFVQAARGARLKTEPGSPPRGAKTEPNSRPPGPPKTEPNSAHPGSKTEPHSPHPA